MRQTDMQRMENQVGAAHSGEHDAAIAPVSELPAQRLQLRLRAQALDRFRHRPRLVEQVAQVRALQQIEWNIGHDSSASQSSSP